MEVAVQQDDRRRRGFGLQIAERQLAGEAAAEGPGCVLLEGFAQQSRRVHGDVHTGPEQLFDGAGVRLGASEGPAERAPHGFRVPPKPSYVAWSDHRCVTPVTLPGPFDASRVCKVLRSGKRSLAQAARSAAPCG